MFKVDAVIVDWLSFTVPLAAKIHPDYIAPQDIVASLEAWSPDLALFIQGAVMAERDVISRRPYRSAIRFPNAGMTIAFGGQQNILFELSGIGCAVLREHGIHDTVVSDVRERITRLDVACDMKGDVHPQSVVDAMQCGRIRTKGATDSDTGQTRYLGSMKSDRFARVYRYHEPHPRAGVTRIECVARRDLAKSVAATIVRHGVVFAAQSMLNYYEIEGMETMHENAGKANAPAAQRTKAGTMAWLIKQAAPAFRTLVREGYIRDPEYFIRKYFLEPLEGQEVQMSMFDER